MTGTKPIGIRALAKELALELSDVDALIVRGLPFTGKPPRRKFDPVKCAEWIEQHALIDDTPAEPEPAKPEQLILRTRAEVARYFDVDIRTVAEWLNDPTFPGRAGGRGRQDGYFPVEDIERWRDEKRVDANKPPLHGTSLEPTARDELNQIKLQQEQIKLSKQLGQLVDVELVKREIVRAHTIAVQTLRPIADMVVQLLPADTPPEAIDDLRQRVDAVVHNAFDSIGQQLVDNVSDSAVQE